LSKIGPVSKDGLMYLENELTSAIVMYNP
jgi:hypothetical protein